LTSIAIAIAVAVGWVKQFIKDAKDIENKVRVVTIEQGTHQPEDLPSGGFTLHFTGRDADQVAFHFYVKQLPTGALRIFEITYMDNGKKIPCAYK
jgi:hypothetical protein